MCANLQTAQLSIQIMGIVFPAVLENLIFKQVCVRVRVRLICLIPELSVSATRLLTLTLCSTSARLVQVSMQTAQLALLTLQIKRVIVIHALMESLQLTNEHVNLLAR